MSECVWFKGVLGIPAYEGFLEPYGCIRLRVYRRSCDGLAINYQEGLTGPDEAPLEVCVRVATTTTTTPPPPPCWPPW